LTDLPRPGDLPELHPHPGQADAALRMVHQRRRRSALRTASTAGALAVVAAFLTARGPSISMLEQTDEGVTKTATAVPSPTGHGGETDSAAGPRLATASGEPEPAASGTASVPDGSAGPTVVPSPAGVPCEYYPAPRPRQPIRREERSAVAEGLDRPAPCTMPVGTGAWCGGALPEYESADEILFRVTICSGHDGFTLPFESEQEIDAVIRTKDGAELWRWGRGQEFPAHRHSIVLDTEECVVWRVPWDYRDDYGRRLPPGRYVAELPVRSDPAGQWATWFTVD